jgi:hypothetical protein
VLSYYSYLNMNKLHLKNKPSARCVKVRATLKLRRIRTANVAPAACTFSQLSTAHTNSLSRMIRQAGFSSGRAGIPPTKPCFVYMHVIV